MLLHCISGMPRSGSTLLCNILAQNPRFHSTHTSGCLDVLFGIRNQWDRLIEHQAHPDADGRQRVLRAVLKAYHASKTAPVIFDKSRGWLAHLEMLEEVLGRPAKILVPVRPLAEILASMEKLHRETAKVKQPPGEAENYFQFQTQAGRCDYWAAGHNLVGLAYNRVQDALQRGYRDRLHLVEFDRLTQEPYQTLTAIYDFLGEEWFPHNFEQVEQVTQEDDTLHGYVNLHVIRPRIEPVPRQAAKILGPELAAKYTAIPWVCS